jgi:L-ribulose-5-phosphate 4-epimerase
MSRSFSELKEKVLEANLGLKEAGLVAGTSGNVSGINENRDRVVIKPSGVEFSNLRKDDLSVVDLDGNIIDGPYKPSVDTASHLVVYRERLDVASVVHTHSPFATSFAARGESLRVLTTTHAALFGGPIPISDYAVIGEEEIGNEIIRHVGESSAVLLRSHGVFTIGSTIDKALRAAIYVEECAQVNHLSLSLGKVEWMPEDVVHAARNWYLSDYGQNPIGSGS